MLIDMGHLFSKKKSRDERTERMDRLVKWSKTPEQLERSRTLLENRKLKKQRTRGGRSRARTTTPPAAASEFGQPDQGSVDPEFQQVRHVVVPEDDEPWFHYGLTRLSCETMLRTSTEGDGTFLVRNGITPRENFILSVAHGRNVYHWRIVQRNDGRFLVGEDDPHVVTHNSVRDLLDFHTDTPLLLNTGGTVKLNKYIACE